MKQRNHNTQFEKRMLSIEELSAYWSLGLTKSRALAKEVGAEMHLGRRVVYDRKVIDAYLDSKIEEGEGR